MERLARESLDEETQFKDYTAMDHQSLGSPRGKAYTSSTIDDSDQNEMLQFAAFENPMLLENTGDFGDSGMVDMTFEE